MVRGVADGSGQVERSPIRSAAPISSASWARTCSRGRPAMQCNSVRMSSSRTVRGLRRRSRGIGTRGRQAVGQLRWPAPPSNWTSRKPPRPLLRSGFDAVRCRRPGAHRSWAWATTSGKPGADLGTPLLAPPPMSSFDRSSSPAISAELRTHRNSGDVLPATTDSACGWCAPMIRQDVWHPQRGSTTASATSDTVAVGRSSCRRMRSRSEKGNNSPRPESADRDDRQPAVGGDAVRPLCC